MALVNNYKPPAPEPPFDSSTRWGPDPWDINWPFPIHNDTLENDLVKLVPWVPRAHAQIFFDQFAPQHDEFTRFLPWGMPTFDLFLDKLGPRWCGNPDNLLLAVLDKTRAPAGIAPDAPSALEHTLAGLVGLLKTSPANMSTEIGPVFTLPRAQRTHVTTCAVGLLLRYCLELPTHPVHPGIGFRRVQWGTHPDNAASLKTARRMGLRDEGVVRWMFVLPEGKKGKESREEDPVRGHGRDSVFLAICWDDWEAGGREKVETLLAGR